MPRGSSPSSARAGVVWEQAETMAAVVAAVVA
jgi:hypothetical protein